MAETYASLVAESFARIALEAPAAHDALAQSLSGRDLRIQLDEETFGVASLPIPVITAPSDTPDVAVQVSSTTVRSVIDGDMSLAEAVTSDHLRATGTLDAVADLHDALLTYVHGAIRAPSVPALRARFDQIAEATR